MSDAIDSTEHDLCSRERHASPYATLFRIPGAKSFCVSGAVARLPISMMALGIVLALNHLYDNWTIAGSMSAAYILAVAAVTPFYARMFDRFGQHRVGPVALTVQVVVMLAFAFAALMRVPIPALFALAIAMGATQFSFGALVRTRWAYVLRGTGNGALLNTAYAMEAAIDEVVFILGPILAAFLATSVHPVSQLFVPTAACGVGGAVFFSLRSTVPPVLEPVQVEASASSKTGGADIGGAGTGIPDAAEADRRAAAQRSCTQQASGRGTSQRFSLRRLHRTGAAKPKNVLTYPGIVPLLVVFIVFNMSFTAFDVSMTATMKAAGVEHLLGLQLAMFAVGSCCGAVIFGSRQLKGSHWRHMVVFLALLTVGYVLFRVTMDNFLLLGAMEVLAGLCVSPLFATGNLIVKDIVPARSLTEGLSWVTTAGSVGTSFGSTLAGAVLDASGPHLSMMIPWTVTLCAVPLALFGWWLARRRR
ncbi:MFS transporter [Bifidobacterium leontopitheci]|uniref:MFS transporter n=1 Tax=Bifidobacterium leontopitheci TaxID=2650774 RepID=A0A6I1GEW5_9BIFI|nr:MFS transporter [Bifidobacterium leontopitheci]KAB7790173.1 MFS transporter [Bifidobacterium leontopitheci]